MPEALIVPGVLAVEPRLGYGPSPAEIVRGPLAGFARLPEITDWKCVYLFVLREAAERLGLSSRGATVDGEAYPHVRAQIDRARVVRIDEAEAGRFIAAGELTIELSYHRVASGGGLRVSGGAADREFGCEDTDLLSLAWGVDHEDEDDFAELWETDPIPRIYDGILRAMTAGEVSLRDLDLALSLDGWCQDPASFERELEELATRGEGQAKLADEVLAALEGAQGEHVTLPGLGEARRVTRPEFTLTKPVHTLTWSGAPLEVPAESHWVVDEVEPFVTAEQTRRNEAFQRTLAERRATILARRQRLRRVLLLALVIAGIMLVRALFG